MRIAICRVHRESAGITRNKQPCASFVSGILNSCKLYQFHRNSVGLSWVPPPAAAECGSSSSDAADKSTEAASSRTLQKSARPNRSKAFKEQLTRELSICIESLAEKCQANAEFIEKKDSFMTGFNQYLETEIPGCKLVPFGSAVNGLWLDESDLDISVSLAYCDERADKIRRLKQICSAIYRLTGDRPETRFKARVPILHWQPQRTGLPNSDISVNNDLAVSNSHLVGQYAALDYRVRQLTLVLKMWARARGINDRSRGTVSSFALTLMLIHFLQRRQILPSLQDLAVAREEPEHSVLGVDCRYCTDVTAVQKDHLYGWV